MARSTRSQKSAASSAPPTAAVGDGPRAKLAVIWAWLAAYLVVYFLWPLANVPAAAGDAMRRGTLWLALVVGDETFAPWLEDASWAAIAQRATILAAAGAIALAATAAGRIGLELGGLVGRLTRLETLVFSAGVGLNCVSLATLALGLCGLLRFEIFAAGGMLAVAGAGWLEWRHLDRPQVGNLAAKPLVGELRLGRRWLWLAAPFVAVLLASAMLPPVDFDVREYHLQAPKEFYQAGRITFLAHNLYANMPLGTEMLSLVGMIVLGDWWTGALVGKTLIAVFAPLTAAALFAAGCRFASAGAGVLAALVYLSIPWMALVSTQGLVEGAFAFYLFAALYAVLLWRGPDSDLRRAGTPALAGFLAGAAVSTKYPAVVFCVLPLGVYIVYQSLRSRRTAEPWAGLAMHAAKPLGVFLLACAVGCGLWFAKNAVLTGNPTYPLLAGVFDGSTRTSENIAQWSQAHRVPNYDPADLVRRGAGVLVGSDWNSPLVVPLAVLAILSRRRRLALVLAGYFGFVFLAWWLATHRIDRFWVPALPLAALLAGMGGAWSDAKSWRATLAVFMAVGLTFSFVVVAGGILVDNRYLADLDRLRNDPARVEPWHRYLNEHAGEVHGVLLVGDAQPFDLDVPTIYNTVFDDSVFEQLARGRTAAEVRATCEAQHISHVYVSWREINRYRSPGNYGISDYLQPQVFADLVAAGVLEELPPIPDDSGQMFRVRPPDAPSSVP